MSDEGRETWGTLQAAGRRNKELYEQDPWYAVMLVHSEQAAVYLGGCGCYVREHSEDVWECVYTNDDNFSFDEKTKNVL